MLSLASLNKMKPGYMNKAAEKRIVTKNNSKVQRSSAETITKFLAALVSGEWIPCKDVISSTGLSQGTVSRAATHLLNDNVIVKTLVKDGRSISFDYKLV